MNRNGLFTAEITVERYLQGVRIDSFLLRHFRNYTPFKIQRMVRAGLVRVDGISVPMEFRVRRGQHVAITLAEPPDKLLAAEPAPLAIVYEDPWLMVIDKPAGQIAHPVGMHNTGTLCNAVQFHLDQQSPRRGLLRPGIVHRLDRYTSGLIAVTKEHLSHRRLSIAFQRSNVAKEYIAIVEGVLASDEMTINQSIGQAHHPGCVLMSCRADARDPRPAQTDLLVLERFAAQTLVRAYPRTGRNHQIRVHLAAIGHPILADEFYGPHGAIKPTKFDRDFEDADESGERDALLDDSPVASPCLHIDRHALHAARLQFVHPITKEPMTFDSALPDDMQQAIARLADDEPQRTSSPAPLSVTR